MPKEESPRQSGQEYATASLDLASAVFPSRSTESTALVILANIVISSYQQLGERDRFIVNMRYFRGMSYSEIARLLREPDDSGSLRKAITRFRNKFDSNMKDFLKQSETEIPVKSRPLRKEKRYPGSVDGRRRVYQSGRGPVSKRRFQ